VWVLVLRRKDSGPIGLVFVVLFMAVVVIVVIADRKRRMKDDLGGSGLI
jgi:hypothetical protein